MRGSIYVRTTPPCCGVAVESVTPLCTRLTVMSDPAQDRARAHWSHFGLATVLSSDHFTVKPRLRPLLGPRSITVRLSPPARERIHCNLPTRVGLEFWLVLLPVAPLIFYAIYLLYHC